MPERAENYFKEFFSLLQVARLYTTAHPMFAKALDKAYACLADAYLNSNELVIGIVGEELAFENEIFFELSKMVKPAIQYLKERQVEKITFKPGLEKDELSKFIAFLSGPKEAVLGSPEEYLPLIGVRNISIGKIGAQEARLENSIPQSAGFIYEDCVAKLSQAFSKIIDAEHIDYLSIKLSINTLMDNLSRRHNEFLKLATFKRYSLETYVHLLNVSILSMYFSSRIGFSREDVIDIGTAALFHDLGKSYISRRLLKKTGQLSKEEFEELKSHSIVGAEMLLEYADTMGILPSVVAFEHHLKYDLTGYPRLKFLRKPHIASLIVSVCDVYDALFQRRGYKIEYSPRAIYDFMNKEKGSYFEPSLLDRFFTIMGVWPIGTIVVLSNEQIAVVKNENEDDIFSPEVEIIFPEAEKKSVNLKEKKNELRIIKYLNPWKEGKQYLGLVQSS